MCGARVPTQLLAAGGLHAGAQRAVLPVLPGLGGPRLLRTRVSEWLLGAWRVRQRHVCL